MSRCAAAVLAALALASCGRGQWREVDARLQQASAPARAAGFAPLPGRNNEFGAFTDSATARWSLDLVEDRPYYLAAACTEGCRGMDLEITLLDGGRTLARDSGGRTDARLSFVAVRSGAHPVRLRVAGCSEGTCRWAAQLYAGRR